MRPGHQRWSLLQTTTVDAPSSSSTVHLQTGWCQLSGSRVHGTDSSLFQCQHPYLLLSPCPWTKGHDSKCYIPMKNLSIYAQKDFCGFQITGNGKDLLWFWIAVVEEAFVVMCPCQGCEFHLHMCHNTQYQSPIPDAQTQNFWSKQSSPSFEVLSEQYPLFPRNWITGQKKSEPKCGSSTKSQQNNFYKSKKNENL